MERLFMGTYQQISFSTFCPIYTLFASMFAFLGYLSCLYLYKKLYTTGANGDDGTTKCKI